MSENRVEINPDQHKDTFDKTSALMVSMSKDGKPNVMALDWKRIMALEGVPVIRAQVAYSRYTYTLLTEGYHEFTINIPSDKTYEAVDVAGFYSGRNTDKFKEANLTIIPGKFTKVPTIKDCLLNYECHVIKEEKSPMSSHHYFYGKILVAYASSKINK